MRGITSAVTIEWEPFGDGERRIAENVTGSVVNNTVVYRDLYNIPRVTRETTYLCRVTIHSEPQQRDTEFITLRLTCK